MKDKLEKCSKSNYKLNSRNIIGKMHSYKSSYNAKDLKLLIPTFPDQSGTIKGNSDKTLLPAPIYDSVV